MMLSFPAETNYNLEGTDKLHNWSELITKSVFKEIMEKFKNDEDQR